MIHLFSRSSSNSLNYWVDYYYCLFLVFNFMFFFVLIFMIYLIYFFRSSSNTYKTQENQRYLFLYVYDMAYQTTPTLHPTTSSNLQGHLHRFLTTTVVVTLFISTVVPKRSILSFHCRYVDIFSYFTIKHNRSLNSSLNGTHP